MKFALQKNHFRGSKFCTDVQTLLKIVKFFYFHTSEKYNKEMSRFISICYVSSVLLILLLFDQYI